MPDIRASLARDIGPLPLWGWILAAIIGVGIGRRVGGGTADEASSSAQAASAATGSLGYSRAINLPNGAAAASTTTSSTSAGFTSNSAWRQAALDSLIAKGYTGTAAESALTSYLNQSDLTADQGHALDEVLRSVGLPPAPPSAIAVAAPAAPAAHSAAPTIYDTDRNAFLVREAYNDFLGRAPDAEGLDFWRGRLASGEIDSAELRREFETRAQKEINILNK